MNTQPGSMRVVTAAILIAMAAANLWMVEIPQRMLAGGNDFLNLYAGGRLAFSPSLYDPQAVRQVQKTQAGWDSAELPYTRPPFYAVLLAPLAALAYPAAVRVWFALNLAALAAFFAVLATRASRMLLLWTLIALFASVPVYAAFVNGQDVPLLLAILAIAGVLRERSRPVAAGLLLSLCAIKFHLLLALPLYLLRRRESRLALGFGSGALAWILVSFAAQGIDWPARYLSLLTSPAANPAVDRMPNLHGALANLQLPPAVEIALSIAVLLLCWLAANHREEAAAWTAMLIASLLISRHAYVQDAALLLPGAVALYWRKPESAAGVLAFVTLVPLFWMLLRAPDPRLAAVPALCLFVWLGALSREALQPA